MNIAIFSRLVAREYANVIDDMPDYPYSFEDVLDIFLNYFELYEEHRGESHPPLKRERIRQYIQVMPYQGRMSGAISDYEPFEYREMIERYFVTPFKNCDYRIGHFFSGYIRHYREWEILYD